MHVLIYDDFDGYGSGDYEVIAVSSDIAKLENKKAALLAASKLVDQAEKDYLEAVDEWKEECIEAKP